MPGFDSPKRHPTGWSLVEVETENMADNIEIAGQFLSAGWNVALYDYRGYGSKQ